MYLQLSNTFIYVLQHDQCLYVTGFWKTNQNVTQGLLHCIGPANSYTLSIYNGITRLGWLVCFSRACIVDHVNSRLRQWDPWRALHGTHGSEIHPSDRETSLCPSKHILAYWLAFLGLITSANSPNRGYNLLLSAQPPP